MKGIEKAKERDGRNECGFQMKTENITAKPYGSSPSYLSVMLEKPSNASGSPSGTGSSPSSVPFSPGVPGWPATPAPATPCTSNCSDCDSRMLRKFTASSPFDVAGTICPRAAQSHKCTTHTQSEAHGSRRPPIPSVKGKRANSKGAAKGSGVQARHKATSQAKRVTEKTKQIHRQRKSRHVYKNIGMC